MKQHDLRTRALVASLMAASAVVASPAVAQDMAPAPTAQAVPAQSAPAQTPPVIAAPRFPQNDSVATPAAARSTPRGASAIGDPASATPVNPAAIAAAQEEAAQRRGVAARPAPRAATPRPEPRRAAPVARRTAVAPPATARIAAPAPAAVAPAPTPVEPAPVAVTPGPAPSAAAPAPIADPPPAAPVETANRGGIPTWPLAILALLVLAAGAFFLMRRRTVDDVVYDEPVDASALPIEPVPVDPVIAPAAAVAAPVFFAAAADDDAPAAPAVPDDVNHIAVEEGELAALTAAAPVGDRPWLEFALRPVRAGSNVDEALVEIDLTVGNAGQVAAHDVRIATFMLATRQDDELRRLLADPPTNAEIEPVTIEPGAGTRVAATLAVLKADLAGRFDPIVVVDARYTLADGSEGRTSAAFTVGVVDPATGATGAIDIARPELFDDVEATLYREPEHA
ncbi:hypothetical protein [Sphingomonas oligophenolica]|uniref:Uncharacterized protein n=1 Tax=Sphingomonas oligophenolica TaxID=301154 RepID=A0A502CAR9_9SPHN|nr:hypothetical protein [Sphingomonas oligophenolica]TPG09943.1 hypothetical protein EAH84_13235 [Sphingomonas oligophenolica]